MTSYSVESEFSAEADEPVTVTRWADDPKYRGGCIAAEEYETTAGRIFQLVKADRTRTANKENQ
jgi:hypothetical protein